LAAAAILEMHLAAAHRQGADAHRRHRVGLGRGRLGRRRRRQLGKIQRAVTVDQCIDDRLLQAHLGRSGNGGQVGEIVICSGRPRGEQLRPERRNPRGIPTRDRRQ